MIRSFGNLVLVAIVALVTAGQVNADIIYSNGPVAGTTGSYTIGSAYSVSDSFTAQAPANLTEVTSAGIWLGPGDTLTSVGWSIGTTPFGSEISSGTSVPTGTIFVSYPGGTTIYSENFEISGSIGAGTYYLTLENAKTANNSSSFWDDNGGPSTATQMGYGNYYDRSSESFTINGNVVPEPSSFALLGLGGIGLAFGAYRRRRAAAV